MVWRVENLRDPISEGEVRSLFIGRSDGSQNHRSGMVVEVYFPRSSWFFRNDFPE
jgi:hypothetical protein